MKVKRRDSGAKLPIIFWKVPGVLLPGPPTGPAQGSEPLGLKIRNHSNRITRRERLLQRSYRSQLENGPIRWARTSESNPLYTSVDASRPHAASADNAGRKLVEPPGIAPGSGPLITSAFIAIVRPKPDRTNIGAAVRHSKRRIALRRGSTPASGFGTTSTDAWRSCGWLVSGRRSRRRGPDRRIGRRPVL